MDLGHASGTRLLSPKEIETGSLNLACSYMLPSSRALYKNLAATGTAGGMHGPIFME